MLRRLLRECDCPPSVIRCVHFAGRVVVVSSSSALKADHQRFGCMRGVPEGGYGCFEVGAFSTCECGARYAQIIPTAIYYGPGYSEDAANAAFDDAERELLAVPS